MTLRKEDMSIFGHCPGHDDFYLVVCSHCGQVVKPQAFEKHCERRHGSVGKLYAHLRSAPPTAQQRTHPRHGHNTPTPGHGTASWSGRSQSGSGPQRPTAQSPPTPPQYRHTKTSKDGVRLSPLEKTSGSGHSESSIFKQPPPLEPPRSSPPPSLRDPPWPHGGPSPSRPSPTERPQSQRGETGSVPVVPGHVRGPRPYKMSKKECDLDKHCGVLDPERKKVCTRLLTCNIHSIHQRRKVMGRSKNFDQLVAELKMGSKSRERAAPAHEGPAAQTPSPEAPREPTPSPHCRRPLTSSPAFRTHTISESGPEEERAVREEGGGSARATSPLTQARVSSDESEGEGPDEPADWHSTPWHPKPLAFCTFGSCALGHGVFTFDRRLHHLRAAVSAMVESHLSAHLWKKIPQASDPQSQSPSAKPSAIPASPSSTFHHSKPRAGNHNATTFKTSPYSSLQGPGKEPHPQSSSTSRIYGQPEKPAGSQPAGHSRPGRTASQLGPGRPRNPVGRPSKQQLRLREEERATAAQRKRKTSLSEAGAISPDRNCLSPDRARALGSSKAPPAPTAAAPPPPPAHGQTNGSLSPGHKPPRLQLGPAPADPPHGPSPWPFKRTHPTGHASPPDPGPHGRGGNSGHHSRIPGYEHRGLGKKRKSSDSSPPHKPHRLPTPPHSGFYPWKESKGVPVGGEKKASVPKPKLHR